MSFSVIKDSKNKNICYRVSTAINIFGLCILVSCQHYKKKMDELNLKIKEFTQTDCEKNVLPQTNKLKFKFCVNTKDMHSKETQQPIWVSARNKQKTEDVYIKSIKTIGENRKKCVKFN